MPALMAASQLVSAPVGLPLTRKMRNSTRRVLLVATAVGKVGLQRAEFAVADGGQPRRLDAALNQRFCARRWRALA